MNVGIDNVSVLSGPGIELLGVVCTTLISEGWNDNRESAALVTVAFHF